MAECFCISSQCTAWEPFRDLIPEAERGSFIDAYKKRLNSDDMETQVGVSSVFGYTPSFRSLVVELYL